MDFGRIAMDPGVAARRFAVRLEEAGLPPFVAAEHDGELDLLKVTWAHGVTLYMDLKHDDVVAPIDEHGRAVILGLRPCCEECQSGRLRPWLRRRPTRRCPDPRGRDLPSPPLHPDDVTIVDRIPVTSPSRTLIDLAEVMTADELRACFARARDIGLLDTEALRAACARVEWRPSLEMLDEVIAEYCD